jgi:hypothetical protein
MRLWHLKSAPLQAAIRLGCTSLAKKKKPANLGEENDFKTLPLGPNVKQFINLRNKLEFLSPAGHYSLV